MSILQICRLGINVKATREVNENKNLESNYLMTWHIFYDKASTLKSTAPEMTGHLLTSTSSSARVLKLNWTLKYFAASRSDFVYIETDLSSCEQRSRSFSMLSISGRSVFCSWYIRTNALSVKYPNRACQRVSHNVLFLNSVK